jgi:hypothetical protein
MKKSGVVTAAVALSLLLLAGGPARGDADSEALEHVKLGSKLYNEGDLRGAREEFAKAHELVPERVNPFRLLGLTEARLGNCESAVKYLEEFLRRAAPDDHRIAEVTGVRDSCKEVMNLPVGRLEVASEPPGAEVRLDSDAAASLGTTPLKVGGVLAGAHVVYLRLPGYTPQFRPVTVAKGETAKVAMKLVKEPVAQKRGASKAANTVAQQPPVVAVQVKPPQASTPPVLTGPVPGHVLDEDETLGDVSHRSQEPVAIPLAPQVTAPVQPPNPLLHRLGIGLLVSGAAVAAGGALGLGVGGLDLRRLGSADVVYVADGASQNFSGEGTRVALSITGLAVGGAALVGGAIITALTSTAKKTEAPKRSSITLTPTWGAGGFGFSASGRF